MEIDYESLMGGKSEDDLRVYIENPTKYTPGALKACISELQKRGVQLTKDELSSIETEIEKKKLAESSDKSFAYNKYKANIVKDLSAPEYYSQRAIWTFSILFSVLSSGILFAINAKKADREKNTTPIIIFSILYFILAVVLINLIVGNSHSNAGLALAFNAPGALLLNGYFWNKYIGKETKFRAKKIWKPLFICITITLISIAIILYASVQ